VHAPLCPQCYGTGNLGLTRPFWYNTPRFFNQAKRVSIDRRRSDIVLRVFKELISAGAGGVSPGAINARLRELGEPMGTWEVRGTLSDLEAAGEIVNDAQTGAWHLSDSAAQLRDTA
jgi:hypothetical protein